MRGLVVLDVVGLDARVRAAATGCALVGDPLGVASAALLRQARAEGQLGGGQEGEVGELHVESCGDVKDKTGD